jgi:tRNA (adenine37-N6)-methyltransferase
MPRKPDNVSAPRETTRQGSSITFAPIGIVRSPFAEKVSAPRQATAAADVEGTIELFPGRDLEHALEDIGSWERLWVVFVFHRAEGWRPKVLPPRSTKRRGVLATRSPHRPNPIGLSAVRLVGVEGLNLRIRDVDILDGTPVLDLKPYVPYADAFPDAGSGWLESARDPVPPTVVRWTGDARGQVEWLAARGIDLSPPVESSLALGPEPNAYRRIRRLPRTGPACDERELAVKDWRIRFRAVDASGEERAEGNDAKEGKEILITGIHSGYRPRDLALGDSPALDLARAFIATFGPRGG